VTDEESGDEPATMKGLLAQLMRHNEATTRTLVEEQFMISAKVAETSDVIGVAMKIHAFKIALMEKPVIDPNGIAGCFIGNGFEILIASGFDREEILQCVNQILDAIEKGNP